MTKDLPSEIDNLRTTINDALVGYRKLSDKAESDLRPQVTLLIDMHQSHADALTSLKSDDAAPAGTSLMADVHKTVIGARGLVDDLDSDLLPALKDGEEHIISKYDDAIAAVAGREPVASTLRQQRAELKSVIAEFDAAA